MLKLPPSVQFIQHRLNRIADLETLPRHFGAEIDVRYHSDDVVLSHDPFHQDQADSLDQYLYQWKKLGNTGTLILNIKNEGVEERCVEMLQHYKITNWSFLDLSMPYFVKYTLKGFSKNHLAVRFSEYEPIEYALTFKNRVTWVWVDCFQNMILNKTNVMQLKNADFKICLISPELNNHSLQKISEFKQILQAEKLIEHIHAICTKRADLWMA